MDTKSENDIKRVLMLFKYLKKKMFFIIVCTLFGLAVGITYAIIKKPVYTATLSFTLQEESKNGGGGLMSLASSFGLDLGSVSGLFSGDNIEQVFKSRKIVEKTMFQQYPKSNETYGEYYLKMLKINNNIKINTNAPSRLRDSLITEMYLLLGRGYLSILKPDKKYDIYEVTLKSTNEEFSMNFVKELLNQVSIFYTETKIKKSKSNVDVLQGRVDSIHKALGGTLYKRAESSILNLNAAYQTAKVPEQFKSIDINALGTGYGELLKNLELAKYSLLKETPLFQIVDEPKMPLKKKEFNMYFYAPLSSILFFIFSIGLLIFYKLIKTVLKQLNQ